MGATDGRVKASAPTGLLRPGSRERVRVLAVDDDPQIRRYVHDALSRAGFSPTVTGDPEDVPRLIEEDEPDLVLLDMLLPGTNGIELMNAILATAEVPVIFLSEYGEDDAIARAFDVGAADYVVKPFSATELAARIRAALRRGTAHGLSALPDPYHAGDLIIDYAERRVTVAGRPVRLTATEYEVLYRLSTAAGRVVTHDQLLQWAWSRERKGESWLVRNVIKKLRGKLGDAAENPVYVFTEPRVGYRMAKREEPGESRP
jgi:two-component system KDP operon response regulator KdpE